MKLAKFLMTPFYTEHIRWLLLLIVHNKSSAFIVNYERYCIRQKGDFQIFCKFAGKHLCWSLLLTKFQAVCPQMY